jgi:hypothetical protein
MTITRKKLDAIARGGSGRTEPEPEPELVLKAKELYREIGGQVDMTMRIFVALNAFVETRGLEEEFRLFAEKHFDINQEAMDRL